MKKSHLDNGTDRRTFLGTLTAGAASMGIGGLLTPFQSLQAGNPTATSDADEWFKKVKGKHRIVYDVTEPNGMMPFAWSRVFLMTNEATGTPSKDCSVVVILRHGGIPFAMNSDLWAKYKFGEVFKIKDDAGKPVTANAFWKPAPGTFKVPGIGVVQIGINELQDSGVMFCVCNAALTVYSAVVAGQMNLNAADVYKEWTAGVLPGIQIVPSGVWAVGRAQEHGCAYCFAGGTGE